MRKMLIICKCAQAHSPTYADTDIRDSIYARVAQATSQTDIGSNSCEEMSHRVRPKAQTDFTVLAQQAPPPCALLASPAADWRFQAERDLSAILPIPWTPALMGDGKDGNHLANHLVHHRIGEVPQVVAPDFIVVLGPVHGSYLQAVNRVKELIPESVRDDGASVEVPEECLAGLCLRFGQNFNVEGAHRELRRCLT
jgi:hypothetical protein